MITTQANTYKRDTPHFVTKRRSTSEYSKRLHSRKIVAIHKDLERLELAIRQGSINAEEGAISYVLKINPGSKKEQVPEKAKLEIQSKKPFKFVPELNTYDNIGYDF